VWERRIKMNIFLNGSPKKLNITKKKLHAIREPIWAALMNFEEFHAICVETPQPDHMFS